MKRKILVGSLRQETNSFSPVKTFEKDFTVYKGEEMLDHIAPTEFFLKKDVEIIPTLCAYAIPSGKVDEQAYLSFKQYILDCIPKNEKIDGVWLYLHGAMNVENIGSGEGLLVSQIREKVGPDAAIAVALDFHANNTRLLVDSANIIYGYRTAPHIDAYETQMRAAELMMKCIEESISAQSVMIKPPLIFPGEMVTTGVEPAKTLIKELDVSEKDDGVLCASIFGCMPWNDAPNTGASVVVTGKKGTKGSLVQAKRLAQLFWDARDDFKFEEEAYEPEEAVDKAVNAVGNTVFLSDSGDNVTGGASGDSAFLLNILIKKKVSNVLVAGIVDIPAVDIFDKCIIGEMKNVTLGAKLDFTGGSVQIDASLKGKGVITGKGRMRSTRYVLLSVEGIDIIVTDERYSFTSPEIIESSDVKIADYKIIVVKLGYIFPELRKISQRSIMALTPGNCLLQMDKFEFKNIVRPMFPVDKDFNWTAK